MLSPRASETVWVQQLRLALSRHGQRASECLVGNRFACDGGMAHPDHVGAEKSESHQDPDADDQPSPLGRWTAEVRHVAGRGSDDSRGLPPVNSVSLSRPVGPDLTLGPIKTDAAKSVRVRVFGVPEIRNFGLCPICGSEEDLTREHVPQRPGWHCDDLYMQGMQQRSGLSR